MVKVLTSHTHIWHPEQVVSDIIKEYQTQGQVVIDLNQEGPCADTIGLYQLLDNVCQKFDFDPKQIKIITANFEEQHSEYQIEKVAQHWIPSTISAWRHQPKLQPKTFDNLFGCLYNVPSWDRLCILSYISRTSTHTNILTCNGTWEANRYNTYYLNSLVDNAPGELSNVVEYLKTNPHAALNDVNDSKPLTAAHMMAVYPLYSKFFVDIVAETYNSGLSFFITEKTLRPMLALTPFIINAPPRFLRALKSDYGFKTFSKWWSEEYDKYQGYQRIQQIYKVIDYLNTLPPAQWRQMYQDMLPTLEHNFNQLIENEQGRRIGRKPK